MLTLLRNVRQWYANPYALLDDRRARDGMSFRLKLPLLGSVLVTGDPAHIRDISLDSRLQGGKGISALRAILGDRSLITLDGEAHQARRALLAPCLRGPHLRAYDHMTVDLTLDEIRRIAPGQPFSAYELTRRISLRVILRLLFGELDAPTEAHAQRLVHDFLNSLGSALTLFLKPLHVDLGPRTPWGRMLRRREKLVAFIREQLSKTHGQEDEKIRANPRKSASHPSLLSHLRQAGLPDDDAIAETLALLLFGHDTGAATMAWALAHILSHPDAAAEVRREASIPEPPAAMPDDSPFLDACLRESMRLRPVVVHLTRVAQAEVATPTLDLDAGETVLPCAYLAHHNPAVFDAPDDFRPRRFLDGAAYPHAYFPYGFGVRTCVGKPFVERQMRLILAALFRHETLRLAPGYTPEPERRMVLMIPRHGALLIRESPPCFDIDRSYENDDDTKRKIER